jgi:hypothetical protein
MNHNYLRQPLLPQWTFPSPAINEPCLLLPYAWRPQALKTMQS